VIKLNWVLLLSVYFVISIVIKLNWVLLLSVYFVISIVIKLNWVLLLSFYFLISIVIKLNLTLLLLVIRYLILTNFTASSILPYIPCNGLSEMPKNIIIRGLAYFQSHAFYSFR